VGHLTRQLGEHVCLASTKDERREQPARASHLRVAQISVRSIRPAVGEGGGEGEREDTRHHECEQAEQLGHVVLDRCPCEENALPRAEPRKSAVPRRSRRFKRMSLVEHAARPRYGVEPPPIGLARRSVALKVRVCCE